MTMGGKTRRKRAGHSGKSQAAGATVHQLHPVVAAAFAAGMPREQFDRFEHRAAQVPNPLGEATIKGEIRSHKACRRVPTWQSTFGAKGVDRPVLLALAWYDDRLGLAYSGLFKCGLDMTGSGGNPFSHVPASVASTEARADIDWARSFIPADLWAIFDSMMVDGETFEQIGRRAYPSLSGERSRKKASSAFRIAANHLLLGIGHLLQTGE